MYELSEASETEKTAGSLEAGIVVEEVHARFEQHCMRCSGAAGPSNVT